MTASLMRPRSGTTSTPTARGARGLAVAAKLDPCAVGVSETPVVGWLTIIVVSPLTVRSYIKKRGRTPSGGGVGYTQW